MVIWLIGMSGSGKTTLARFFLVLELPSFGDVLFFVLPLLPVLPLLNEQGMSGHFKPTQFYHLGSPTNHQAVHILVV